jgi:hypothetical protein
MTGHPIEIDSIADKLVPSDHFVGTKVKYESL